MAGANVLGYAAEGPISFGPGGRENKISTWRWLENLQYHTAVGEKDIGQSKRRDAEVQRGEPIRRKTRLVRLPVRQPRRRRRMEKPPATSIGHRGRKERR